MSHKLEILKARVLELSVMETWEDAVEEWEFVAAWHEKEPGNCTCTHPIIERCLIQHKFYGDELIVGNVCIQHFSSSIKEAHDINGFTRGLKRIMGGHDAAPSLPLLKIAHAQGWISDKDYDFGANTCRKRRLSLKQENWRQDINRRILAANRAAQQKDRTQ